MMESKQLETQIIDKILGLSLDVWFRRDNHSYIAHVDTMEIILYDITNQTPHISIDNENIFSERLRDYRTKVLEFNRFRESTCRENNLNRALKALSKYNK